MPPIASHHCWPRGQSRSVAGRSTVPLGADRAIALWAVQLVLNGLWSWIFFGLHRTGLALIDIGLVLAMIAMTTVSFMHRDRLAGYLMLPYLAWVTFASVLNFSLWLQN